MKRRLKSILATGALAAFAALAPASSATQIHAPPPPPAQILVRAVGEGGAERAIAGSKWGFIGELQRGLNAHAAACNLAPLEVTGLYGPATAAAVARAQVCLKGKAAPDGALTDHAFTAITRQPAPDALDRARLLTRMLEGSDYDTLAWNICVSYRGDRASVLTWGPYGRTLGWGGEMLATLKKIDRAKLNAAFDAAGARGLDRLLALKTARELGVKSTHRYPGAQKLMAGICAQKGQMKAWRDAFATLGADPEVRAIYDADAWGQASWFRKVVDRLADSWQAAGLTPSEVDYAFFIDRSIHMGWGSARFAAVDAALATAKARAAAAGETLTSAQARLAVAMAVRPSAHPTDRLARDVVFLVDAEADLAPAMGSAKGWPPGWRNLWAARARITAADVGLSDDRLGQGFPILTAALAQGM
ncbi:MAG: hypothetical protein ACOYJ6_11355 [Caulobacterales bacterium]|jgi:hypothetical protein